MVTEEKCREDDGPVLRKSQAPESYYHACTLIFCNLYCNRVFYDTLYHKKKHMCKKNGDKCKKAARIEVGKISACRRVL